jgi:undecaprenyl phosphate-alpha-L-ara4N flippase subunit ArnE
VDQNERLLFCALRGGLRVLAIAPLTLAAPIASLNYIGVVLSGRWLFHEHMTARQWVGSGLVTLGVIAVAWTGG